MKYSYFLIGCSWEYYERVATEIHKAIDVWPCLWTTSPTRVNDLAKKFPHTTVVNAHEFTCANLSLLKSLIPQKLDYEPLSSLWQEQFAVERMMVLENLLHRSDPGGNYTQSELRDTVNAYFLIAHNLLIYYAPKVIYFEVPPHTMYDLALYYVAKKNKIKLIMGYDSSIPACSVLMHEFNSSKSFIELPVEMKENEDKKNELIDQALLRLGVEMPFYMGAYRFERSYYSMIFGLVRVTLSAVKTKIREISRMVYSLICRILGMQTEKPVKWEYRKRKKYLQSVRSASVWDMPFHFIKNIILELDYRKKTTNFSIEKILKYNKFVFIPLSLQHEMSTMPAAGFMYDQKCYIEMICHSIPSEWRVVVKENPKQFKYLTGVPARDSRFYNDLKELGVIFAPLDFPSNRLMESAEAVAVTTGTAGIEAILKHKKPALMFAHTWYSGLPGTKFIDSFDKCKSALRELVSGTWCIDKNEIDVFIPKLRNRLIYLWGEGSIIKEQKWDQIAIVKNIANSIKLMMLK